MNIHILIFLFLNKIVQIFSVIPTWNMTSVSIDLLSSKTTYEFIILDEAEVQLKKVITKTDNIISSKNYLTVKTKTLEVDFDNIGHYYEYPHGSRYILCPKGKFHPFDFNHNESIIPENFVEKGDWDLKCESHYTDYFFIYYLRNEDLNVYALFVDMQKVEFVDFSNYNVSSIYDFTLQNILYRKFNDRIIVKDSNNITLMNSILELRGNYIVINQTTIGSHIIQFLDNTQAYFEKDNNNYLYFFTYNDIYDFNCGYGILNNDKSLINQKFIFQSIFEFIDGMEIIQANFIQGTKYVYYILKNKINGKKNYGIMDVTSNKILYNLEDEIINFFPYSENKILLLTQNSAYQLCIIKSGNTCINTCSNPDKLILDIEGNRCSDNCEPNQIKLMPEEICITKDKCDLKFFVLNEAGTECGLCKYFYLNEKKYKLINTPVCLATVPNNVEFYNKMLFLLKCKNGYHIYNNNT